MNHVLFNTTEHTESTEKSSYSVFSVRSVFSVLKPAVLIFIALPHTASACAVCFGDPDSPLAKGLSWGVLSLLAVVLLVLGGITAFFVHMAKRARMSQITAPQEELQP